MDWSWPSSSWTGWMGRRPPHSPAAWWAGWCARRQAPPCARRPSSSSAAKRGAYWPRWGPTTWCSLPSSALTPTSASLGWKCSTPRASWPDEGAGAMGGAAAGNLPGRKRGPAHAAHDLLGTGGGPARVLALARSHERSCPRRRDRGVDRGAGPDHGRHPVRSAGPQRAAAELSAGGVRHPARTMDRTGGVRSRDLGGHRAPVLRPDGAAARGHGAAGAVADPDVGREFRNRAQREPQSALWTVIRMSLVNFTAREITCKIVYYGPGRSGKTTNLQYVYGRVPESRRGRMVSLATQTDRTLFFDFLPLELGSISGFTTKFQLYTVPGQSYYNATRKLVLQGADGVVFVGDSQARRFDDNLESLQNLQDNLLAQSVDIRLLPVVFQYNKQDLPGDLILSHEEMDDALNFRAVPSFAADALHGSGVFETLRGISELVLKRLAVGSPVA